MRQIGALITALAVVATTIGTSALAEKPVTDDSILTSAFQDAKQSEEGLIIADDDACTVAGDSCDVLYRYCGPRWSARVDALIWQRNDMPFIELAQGEEGATMTSSDIDVDWGSGPRFELTRHMDCGWDLEVGYFKIDNFTSTAEAHDSTPLSPTWYWRQFEFDDLWAQYGNDLQSLELNVKWPLCESGRWQGIAGFRWAELDEELLTKVAEHNFPYNDEITITARQRGRFTLTNDLYGFQLGAEGVLWEPCCSFRVEGLAKGGLYGNDVGWTLRTNGVLDERLWDKHKCQSAFVSELGLMAVYQPCCWFTLFGGYEAFHLKEVATVRVQDKYHVNLDHAFFHGVVVGLEIAFGSRGCYSSEPSCLGEPSCACE